MSSIFYVIEEDKESQKDQLNYNDLELHAGVTSPFNHSMENSDSWIRFLRYNDF